MPSDKSNHDTSLTLLMRLQTQPADGAAWEEFVQRYQPMVRAWCVKWGSQSCDADDVTQEVLIKLLKSISKSQYDPARSFRPWLKAIAHNAWHDFVAARPLNSGTQADRLDSVVDSNDAIADLESQLEEAYNRELLELAMKRVEKRVKPTTWRAFRLTAIEHRTGSEVAIELGMAIALVFVARHRVQKLLQEEVKVLNGDLRTQR